MAFSALLLVPPYMVTGKTVIKILSPWEQPELGGEAVPRVMLSILPPLQGHFLMMSFLMVLSDSCPVPSPLMELEVVPFPIYVSSSFLGYPSQSRGMDVRLLVVVYMRCSP